jgi:hypothetical protein
MQLGSRTIVRRLPDLPCHATLHHGEAAFWLSRKARGLEWSGALWPPELKPAVRNEQEHRNKPALAGAVRMPCELPGLAKMPFAGRALRSKAVVRGGNPERRGPTMVLVMCCSGAGFCLFIH